MNIYFLLSWYERHHGVLNRFFVVKRGLKLGIGGELFSGGSLFPSELAREVRGPVWSLSAAGKMSLFLPVTETTSTQFQHPIRTFRYTTLSSLPGEFHPSLYHSSADWYNWVPLSLS